MLNDCAQVLQAAAWRFCDAIPKAELHTSPHPHFRYPKPDEKIFYVLRSVRIASGVRACLVLLQHGHIQETGVLIRTILEFVHDIDFAIDGLINKEHLPNVQKRMHQYFSDTLKPSEVSMTETKKMPITPRQKIYAAVARLFGGANPFWFRQATKTLEDTYSGYVHGNYLHVMELYEGNSHQFSTSGVPQKVKKWLHYLALSVHPALNTFSTVASAFDIKDLEKDLIDQRNRVEESAVYKST